MKNKLILESKAIIRFQDCDPFNHLNNANYINYFINHREDQILKTYNLDIYNMMKKTGKGWVIGTNQIAYFKPAFTMETVVIQSQLIDFSDTELFVEMRMYDENKTHLKALLWSSFIHFNLIKLKKEIHSIELKNLFKTFSNPLEEKSFYERVKNFKINKEIML